jgi:hypothetical protein
VLDDFFGAIVASLRVVVALVLTFFLPGYLLVNVLYPRKGELDREYDGLYRVTLGIVLSIAVTVLWDFLLNSLGVNASTNFGFVVGANIAAGLLGLSLLFFVLGWWRGAYPWMARLHPSLARTPRPAPGDLFAEQDQDARTRMKLEDLAERRERLRKTIKDYERRMRLQSPDARAHYVGKRDDARRDLKKVEAEIKVLEEERAKELYG